MLDRSMKRKSLITMDLSSKEISPKIVLAEASFWAISRDRIENLSFSYLTFIFKASSGISHGVSIRDEFAPTNYENKDSQERATRICFKRCS